MPRCKDVKMICLDVKMRRDVQKSSREVKVECVTQTNSIQICFCPNNFLDTDQLLAFFASRFSETQPSRYPKDQSKLEAVLVSTNNCERQICDPKTTSLNNSLRAQSISKSLRMVP